MNEDLSPLKRDEVIRFAQKELNVGLREREKNGEFSRENWEKCAQFGILGLPIPTEYGGQNVDIVAITAIMEALGYGCHDNGLIFALNAQMWSVQLPILTFGSEKQKEKYLPDLCNGKLIAAHGMTEPNSGSDAYSLSTKAEKRNEGYILNGTKTFVGSAPIADIAVVFATVDPSQGIRGVTAFIVDTRSPGFVINRELEKMGLRTHPMGELTFQDCFVPEENRLGPEGAGVGIFNHSMEWERSFILASCLGTMERQLETCIQYAQKRRQFNQPIGKFQSVGNRIADMKVRLETARLMLYKVAWLKKMKKSAVMEAAIAKLYLSECFVQSGLDAIRVHGGYGYLSEYEVERDLRDALGGTLASGTSDIQRVIIAKWLGL
ncbi:acyl-CoA dehydrogenase family protein [Candidatus Nitronereus thalassa]|uniref:Acyl-CoA dehydrogenase family protein n=1 Tax=Candidatus Nitronereus thalassa TaxID=3020898 RepID=A0ABU3K596_9BACT|nr:acyl-CoA dehydrogenase family protein [Candidatus Nitronereus thalassa]MDT7041548.1 acyl-CoA dehydrogenase family protein [Candidatus Nitronereus thalassa]